MRKRSTNLFRQQYRRTTVSGTCQITAKMFDRYHDVDSLLGLFPIRCADLDLPTAESPSKIILTSGSDSSSVLLRLLAPSGLADMTIRYSEWERAMH